MDADERFMYAALDEAHKAMERDEVPIGAVVVDSGRIIGRGHNQKETLRDPTAHAEILAISAAAAQRGDWRLTGCSIYVTLEPCPMCAGAIVLARIARLVYGAADPKFGGCASLYSIADDPRTNHQAVITAGVCAGTAGNLLGEFFGRQRAMGKK